MMNNPKDSATRPFQTDERTPTIAFEQPEETLALPYDSIDSIEFDRDRCIRMTFQKHEIRLCGSNLEKLFEAITAYRVREVCINGGIAARSLGGQSGMCLIDRIEINATEEATAA